MSRIPSRGRTPEAWETYKQAQIAERKQAQEAKQFNRPIAPPPLIHDRATHDRATRLVAALPAIPAEIQLTPTYRKEPFLPNWAAGMPRSELTQALKCGAIVTREDGSQYRKLCDGYAAVLGDGLIVADFDGRSALDAGCELARDNGGMQPTPAWKGAKGKSALYRLPDELRDRIAKLDRPIRKIRVTEGCAVGEAIELLYQGSSATLPPSNHPETPDGYKWLNSDDQPQDFSLPIATAPKWICDLFEAECEKQEYWQAQPKQNYSGEVSEEQIREWLESIDIDAIDYDSWIKIGMAVKSALPDDRGLELWEEWSQGGEKYRPGDCDRRWEGFTADRVPIAYLAQLAGFELAAVGAGVGFAKPDPERTEGQRQRDRLIAKKMMVYRSNYKEAVDRATLLSETPEAETVWYEGHAPTLELTARTDLVQGNVGSGKTEALLRTISEKHNNQPVILIVPRRALGRDTETRAEKKGLDVYVYQDDVSLFRRMLRTEQPGLYVFCPQGLSDYHTSHIDWQKAIVIVDEFSGIRQEVPGAGDAIFAEYERMLREAGTLVAADAHLSDADLCLLQMYRPGSRKIYRQVEVKATKKIRWAEVKTKKGKISLSHDGAWYGQIDAWIEQKLSFVIACDCKLTLLAIQLHCEALGATLSAATADTIEFNRKLFPAPTEYIGDNNVRHLGFTPVAQSGLDIQAPFDRGMLIYQGIVQPDQALQMMGRARQCHDWIIFAPRRSTQPAVSFNALTTQKIERTSVELAKTLHSINSGVSLPGAVWGNYQRLLSEVYGAYSSEALQCLLEEKFEAIETIELEGNAELHKTYCKRVKHREAGLIRAADAEHGASLRKRQQAPTTDAEVWDIEAAKLAEIDPLLWARVSEMEEEQAIELICVLRSGRINKVKNWVAVMHLPEEARAAALAQMKRRAPNPNSKTYRQYQFLTLHQQLNLDKLARAQGKAIAHETHFKLQSPEVAALYEKFKANRNLTKLFPQVESLSEFWGLVRRCMSAMGYQSAGKSIRVESETPVPNGKNRRDGSQRYSNSCSPYFSAWKPMAESGSELFQTIFPELVEALRDRLLKEYESIAKDVPPDIPKAA